MASRQRIMTILVYIILFLRLNNRTNTLYTRRIYKFKYHENCSRYRLLFKISFSHNWTLLYRSEVGKMYEASQEGAIMYEIWLLVLLKPGEICGECGKKWVYDESCSIWLPKKTNQCPKAGLLITSCNDYSTDLGVAVVEQNDYSGQYVQAHQRVEYSGINVQKQTFQHSFYNVLYSLRDINVSM